MKKFALLFALVVLSVSAFAQVPSAKDAVDVARAKAGKEGKAVFVRFTASWCGWCHRMQSVLDKPEVKAVWDKYFVSTPIVVLEQGENEKLENAGGEELMKSVGGENQGIPFFYFVDAKSGKMIINSLIPAETGKKPQNVGCPYQPEEVAFFMTLLKKAAPKMTDAERKTIEAGFTALRTTKN